MLGEHRTDQWLQRYLIGIGGIASIVCDKMCGLNMFYIMGYNSYNRTYIYIYSPLVGI